jgi:hypothetical protein
MDDRRPARLFGLSPVYWREAALCMPAMPLIMLAGVAASDLATGAIATGAAFSVGFGAARDLRGRRWGAMWGAMLTMTAATLVGMLVGASAAWTLPVNAAAAAACAALALYDEDLWWLTLQAVIALLVAEYYPGDLGEAGWRACVVLGGGLAQIGCVVLLARVAPHAAERLPRSPDPAPPTRRAVIAHAVRAAVCVSIALPLAWHWHLANSYWAPMTGMLVLKPGLRDTGLRGGQRVGGTLAGCVAATLFVLAVGADTGMLLAGLAAGVGIAFAIQKANYAALTLAITWVVVLLLTIAHGGVVSNVEHRVIATLLGGGVALAVAGIAPRRPPSARRLVDRVGSIASAFAPLRAFR